MGPFLYKQRGRVQDKEESLGIPPVHLPSGRFPFQVAKMEVSKLGDFA